MGKKPMRVCLNMIVKNEAHIIEQTLEHLKPYICYWIISDTGSTDGTQDIIKNFFAKANIKGELVHHAWEDFGTNRSLALDACEKHNKHFDYIWVFDADDLVVGELKWPKISKNVNKNPDVYQVKYGDAFTYMRNQLFKASEKWRYVGVLHEYPQCTSKKNVNMEILTGKYYIDSRRLGARNKCDPKEKYRRDAETLEKGLSKEPNNVRYMFYLAQSYMDGEIFDKAIYWYTKRVEAGQWFEEVFYSLYKIGTCLHRMGKPFTEVEKAFLKAWKYLPSRSEPLYEIAKYYRITGDYSKGYKYAKIGSTIIFPKDQVLFLSKSVYDWQMLDELAICASYIGKYEESIKIGEKILSERLFPADQHERLKKNLELSKLMSVNERNTLENILNDSTNLFSKIKDLRYGGRHDVVMNLAINLLNKYGLTLQTETLDILDKSLLEKIFLLYMDISISSYYTNYREYMLKICEKILYTKTDFIDAQNLSHISANRRFVLPQLSDLTHIKNINIKFNVPQIPNTNKKFCTSNPSIINYGDKYYLNIRCTNSKNNGISGMSGIMEGDNKHNLNIRNFLLELDANFSTRWQKELIVNLDNLDNNYLENLNLAVSDVSEISEVCKKGELYFFTNLFQEKNEQKDQVLNSLNSLNGIISLDNLEGETININDTQIVKLINFFDDSVEVEYEKNLLVHYDKGIKYLYGQNPITILERQNDNIFEKKIEIKNNINTGLWKNSAGPLIYENGYLCIINEVIPNGKCHKFVHYDNNWKILNVSLPFKINISDVEHCHSIAYSLDRKYILLGCAIENTEIKILSLLTEEIKNILYHPLPYFITA